MVESKFSRFIHFRYKFSPRLPSIDEKSETGKYIFNLGQTQYLRNPWYAKQYKIWGSPFKKWYKSYLVRGCSIVILIVLLLIIIPSTGLLSIPYPISTTQNIQVSQGSTIDFNYYLTKSVYLSKGNTISYSVKGDNPFSFSIWDQSFNKFPISDNRYTGFYNDSFRVENGQFYPRVLFLHKGDSIKYIFNTTQPLSDSFSFYITNNPDFNSSSSIYTSSTFTKIVNGTFISPQSNNYYLLWNYNGKPNTLKVVSISIQYNLSSINMSGGNLNILHTENIPQNTFIVPKSGNYRFFIFFDPYNESNHFAKWIDVSLNIIFHQRLNGNDNWIHVSDFLVVIGIIMLIIVILDFFQHKYAMKFEKAKRLYYSDFSLTRVCYKCRSNIKKEETYCYQRGAKLIES